jgi:hypothetical protein
MAAMAAGLAPAAGATDFGLSDQHQLNFLDRRFRELPIDHVRLTVPWDVALTDPTRADAWLNTAANLGLTPLVAFEHGAGDRCPAAPCRLPALAEYREAVAAFRARWPFVRELTGWNEPNHPSQPTVSDPTAAAAMHDALRRDCPTCLVVAGDTVDSASMRGWVRDYRAALTTTPAAWSLHNYGDTTYDRPSYTEWLLSQVDGPVWITETGGIARLESDGHVLLPHDEARAADSVRKALAIVRAHPDRIQRAYFYQWVAGAHEAFDSGLLRPDGSGRPSLEVVRDALGTRPVATLPEAGTKVRPVEPGATGGAAAPGGLPARTAAWPRPGTRRPRRVHGGYRLRIRCRPGRVRCAGTVTLAAARRAGGRRLVLGSRRFAVHTGGASTVTVRVWPSRARRARRHDGWRLFATVVAGQPPRLSERAWRMP